MKKLQPNKLTEKLESAYIKEANKLQAGSFERRLTSMDHVDDFILEPDNDEHNGEDGFYFPKRI